MAAARITRSGVDLEATEAGTRITQSFQVTKLPRWLEQLLVRINPTHIDRSAALREGLHRLAEVAAQQEPTRAATPS
jgi:hypothetical protein